MVDHVALVQLDKDEGDGDQQDGTNADQDAEATRRVHLDKPVERGEAKVGCAIDSSYDERSDGEDAHSPVADPYIPLSPWREL